MKLNISIILICKQQIICKTCHSVTFWKINRQFWVVQHGPSNLMLIFLRFFFNSIILIKVCFHNKKVYFFLIIFCLLFQYFSFDPVFLCHLNIIPIRSFNRWEWKLVFSRYEHFCTILKEYFPTSLNIKYSRL